MASTDTGYTDPALRREARRVIAATFIGTTIEWYDFFLYAACAALIFAPQFFPSDDPVAGQLGAFITFSFGFVARPLGGIIAGHFGDRIGRKRMLVLSLYVMGGATALIGIVPNYETIGVWAPVLLVVLRLAQGLGVGAEWGGAVTMAVEYAPAGRRALWGSAPMTGLPVGLGLANLMLVVLLALTGPNFQTWGWRIGFVISVVLVIVGLWTRRRLTESPLFEKAVREAPARVPFLEVFARYTPRLLLTIVIAGVPSILSYLVLTWALSYGTGALGYTQTALLWVGIACCVLQAVMIPLLAGVADRRGLVPMGVAGGVLMAVTVVIFFLLFETGDIWLAALGTIVAHASTSFAWSVVPAILARAFPDRLRYTGVSLAYQLGAIVGGGVAPLIATALLAATGSTTPITVYVVLASLLLAVCVLLLPPIRRSRVTGTGV
ncbi:MAG: MFS transporter [Microbacterium sp.]